MYIEISFSDVKMSLSVVFVNVYRSVIISPDLEEVFFTEMPLGHLTVPHSVFPSIQFILYLSFAFINSFIKLILSVFY